MNPIFAHTIEKWYARNGRDLPWRHTRDPYVIWVSEIILQQTRVEQGLAYFHRFMERFPTVDRLAEAPEDEVLLMWQGLGYYSRARHLHAAARRIMEWGGFPTGYRQVLALPGVGEYTAAAICSFAYDQPYAVLDGNVYRVLARYLGLHLPVDSTAGRKLFRAMADDMLDTRAPALYNQSIMDFGALVCTPRGARCAACPLAESCVAYNASCVDELPCKSHRTRVRHRYFTYLLMEHPELGLFLHRREAGDIWQGLYEPCCHESGEPLAAEQVLAMLPGSSPVRSICGLRHQLSHQLIHADCYLFRVPTVPPALPPGIWVHPRQLAEYAMPRLIMRLMEQILT